MKKIAILGSTGSIGTQTLDVIRNNDDLCVVALAAGTRVAELEKQAREFHPQLVCAGTKEGAKELKERLADTEIKVVCGDDGLVECAALESADVVVTAVVGMMGIIPTIEAIKAGKDIALANKETLVTAGHIIMSMAKQYNVNIYPVDSEHSAIFQCLNGEHGNKISKILLTASGGPFRGKDRSFLENVKLADALKHPNWSMGRKITIDSSTMVNKGLEVIEAKWLFGVEAKDVQVVIQPQSVIHSMVEFQDGAVMAQLGTPDMRLPIQYALTYPERLPLANSHNLDFWEMSQITFEKPDTDTFLGLPFAYEAAERGGNVPTAFNAANELAVSKFLNEKIKYLEIYDIIRYAMDNVKFIDNPSVEDILTTEKVTYELIESRW
jgi:1-deoxy-D-xylulose-5-phosphate reductoisomerase